jgi:murein DD-endopeptidase MepM/ murein hydrolase activator NlpD
MMSSKFPKSTTAPVGNPKKIFQQSIAILGGLGLLSTNFLIPSAIATETLSIPDAPAPTFVDSTPAPPSVTPIAAPRPKVDIVAPSPSRASRRRSNPDKSAVATPRVRLSAPRISISTTSPVVGNAPIETQPSSIRNSLQGKNSYVDTTDYSVGKSKKADSTPSVVLSERSTGCQTMVQGGSLNRGCGGATASRRRSNNTTVARSVTPRYQRLASSPTRVSANNFLRRSPRVSPVTAIAFQPSSSQYYRNRPNRSSYSNNSSNINPNQVVSLEPIIRRGISIALAPLQEYNRATTAYAPAAPDVRQENTDLLFPLPMAVPLTSAFGWRIHPVLGTGRMHSGTDLGAPTGTPVLAAYAGEVSMADWSGGYGLMVVLRHLEGTQESRYAHLSEVLVKSGQSVQKGEIIGRVGSTGLSTGPHLHFEWRHLTNNGWVAVDAGTHLEYAMANLMRNEQLASVPARPQG